MSSKTDNSAESNPAVFRCKQAWTEAYRAALGEGKDDEDAGDAADYAYSEAMPPLFGVRNIRNFIACVAHGSMLGIIDRADCSRLLYAAQIAFSARRIARRHRKTPRALRQKRVLQEPFQSHKTPLRSHFPRPSTLAKPRHDSVLPGALE